jgi:hypothetical protein
MAVAAVYEKQASVEHPMQWIDRKLTLAKSIR